MSRIGAAPRAVVPVSDARAEASRKNGAKSRGPKTPEGKGRSARNALKHGMRAQKYVVLPEEDAGEFAELEAALVAELAPVGSLQSVLARRIAVAAWRLARADRIETELFAARGYGTDANPGLALIRDGNGTRSFETLLRYRGAAMAEFWRALRTLKALQAEQAAQLVEVAAPASAEQRRPALRCGNDRRSQPDEPDRYTRRRFEDLRSEPPTSGGALHEAPAPWGPNEPEHQPAVPAHAARGGIGTERTPPPRASSTPLELQPADPTPAGCRSTQLVSSRSAPRHRPTI